MFRDSVRPPSVRASHRAPYVGISALFQERGCAGGRRAPNFLKLGETANLAHPTYDHFLPLLYCLGLRMQGDHVTTFNDNFQWPAVSMRSLVIA